ncbi:C39 family peptidase [Herbaspirillum frisingense]|uniref:C39 family peptidase n=1 Tax=Herbaspirillum frisingense TaxID=92645 RepID=UPI001F255D57|nr:cysteine peptidase family C39 domain-containing protein [Herbaspirillum frisingense]UIN20281.1 peptidase C39 [Herbaspirillum frisingense]
MLSALSNALAGIVFVSSIASSPRVFSSDLLTHSKNQISPGDILFLNTHTAQIRISIQSWKSLRDSQIIKQDFDYSCSAASLATLLNGFYGQSLDEESLLKAMDRADMRASFDDMQKALTEFGFKAQGFAASYEQLTKLKAPVVVYLKHRKDDHFSVLRGINKHTVWLADPSLGNKTYSKAQFLEMWQTRSNPADADLSGKILAILPISSEISTDADYFSKNPLRQTSSTIEQLKFRLFH